MTAEPHPVALAVFILGAFALAGFGQAAWLGGTTLESLRTPIDRGATFRGRRLFGDNKTVRGLVVMIPATGASFALVHAATTAFGAGASLWPGGAAYYFGLGLAAGAGFMIGELPNSFVKRQLDIPPGEAATGRVSRWVALAADRMDSVIGALVAIAIVAGVPVVTWLLIGLGGPLVHGLFSAITYRLGGKARVA